MFKTKTPLGKDGKALKQSSNSIVGYLESLQLYYNANNELEKSIKTHQQGYQVTVTTTTYEYDAFGRRIAKHSEVQQQSTITFDNKRELKHGTVQHTPTQQQSKLMLWDGNRQAQEYTDTHVFTTVYEQDSFEPVAKLAWLQDELLQSANDEIIKAERESWEDEPTLIPNVQIYHYHNDHLGTPNELTDDKGEVVWLADYEAWGNTTKVVWREEQLGQLQVKADELQPLRFQGQSFDTETGLHYNRFRYFDPDLGMFVSRDPIGLMGGFNTFQYAPNPTGWIDPWGLAKKKGNKDCCEEEDKKCGSAQNPWKKVYEENAGKHKTKGYWNNKNWVSPKPTNGALYLQTAVPYRTKSLVGYDPINNEVIQYNRHLIDETNCVKYYHGFVVNGQPVKMDQKILNIANSLGFKGRK